MNKMYKLFIGMSFMAALWGCDQKPAALTSVSGAYTYQLVKEGEGEQVKDGEYIVANLAIKDSKDSTWVERMVPDGPAVIFKEESRWLAGEAGFTEIFFNVKKGDSLIFEIPAMEFFQGRAPAWADTTGTFTFFCGIDSIYSASDFQALQEEQMQKDREEQMAAMREGIDKDIETIKEHLRTKNLEAVESENGILYIIHEEGEGPKGAPGQTATVNYSGFLLDGTLFDTSVEEVARENGSYIEGRPYSPYVFTIDRTGVITGWHEGFKLLNKGTKATLYIPSPLAYGERGSPPVIPPGAPLVFEVELLNLE